MTNYQKEDIERVMKELAEYLGPKYPGLPFMLILSSSDGINFARSTSQHLNDPNQAMKLLANNIAHTAQQLIDQQFQMLQMLESQKLMNMIEGNKNKPIN